MVFIITLFVVTLLGCNNEQEKVNVDFRVNGSSILVKMEKGKTIKVSDVPIDEKDSIYNLYYDANYTEEYKDEVILEDIIIYVKLKNINNNDNLQYLEEEDLSLVTFIVQDYTYAYSSVSGTTMKFHKDDATFECTIDKGSFRYNGKVNYLKVSSGENVMWCPSYIINDETSNQSIIEEVDNIAYMDVLIKIDNKIIGYIVIDMNQINSTYYKSNILVSKIFPKINGEYQNVPLDYVLERIQNIKNK